MRTIQHRQNNAYDSILLLEDGTVVGQWTTTQDDQTWADWLNPGDLDNWHGTDPDQTDPDAYGDLIREKFDTPDKIARIGDVTVIGPEDQVARLRAVDDLLAGCKATVGLMDSNRDHTINNAVMLSRAAIAKAEPGPDHDPVLNTCGLLLLLDRAAIAKAKPGPDHDPVLNTSRCPNCQCTDPDRLVWQDDVTVKCDGCGHQFTP